MKKGIIMKVLVACEESQRVTIELRKLSMQNVESGTWASKCEDATGHHESRRYNKSRA